MSWEGGCQGGLNGPLLRKVERSSVQLLEPLPSGLLVHKADSRGQPINHTILTATAVRGGHANCGKRLPVYTANGDQNQHSEVKINLDGDP